MNEKQNKSHLKLSLIAFGLISIGLGISIYSSSIKMEEHKNNLDLHQITVNNLAKNLNNLEAEIEEKSQSVNRKIAILSEAEKILSATSNEWSIVFTANLNKFKTIDLYGYARSEQSKQQILSIISKIPDVYVIRENIVISPERKWLDNPEQFKPFDPETDIIRQDVKILSYSEEEFLKLQNQDNEQLEKEKANNLALKKKIDKEMFDDPLLYSEITDIKVIVTELVPEVSGLLSTPAHKERINTILNKYKERGEIYTFVNRTITPEEKSRNKDEEIEKSFSRLVSIIRSEAEHATDEEKEQVEKHISILKALVQENIENERKMKNSTTEKLIEEIPTTKEEFEKQQKEDENLELVYQKLDEEFKKLEKNKTTQ